MVRMGGGIAVHDRGGGGDVAGGVEILPVERVARVRGELSEEGTLRAAVSLAERRMVLTSPR